MWPFPRPRSGCGTLNGFRVVNELDETETYDPQGKLISLSNRAGLTQTFTYDSTRQAGCGARCLSAAR